ncbi:stalk domain-containing protein [Anoxynatronum sibiricum]|uniref:Stalk domain-containing protein n=1 Tax=Anoxynatronum sibiricum TaxID=210623 RepID=A0ABU9VX12_9CLOT
MKMKQRLALVIILALVLSVIAPAGLPVYGDAGGSAAANHTFHINEGNITIASGTGEHAGKIAVTHQSSPSVTAFVYAADNIIITGTTTTNRVVVNSGVTANITLSDANISRTSFSLSICVFDMSGAIVNLTLVGDNFLRSNSLQPGLKVPEGATLTIKGPGSLKAENAFTGSSSAGIGGSNNQAGGIINIIGGTITAMGGNSGAGLGGGGLGNGGTINISGGTVTAIGGDYGAGIGGGTGGSGGIINITGGTVSAAGGRAAAGIGGGLNGGSGTVSISGNARVTATGGGPILERQNGWDIGSGSDNTSNGTLRIQGDGNQNPTVIFTTYGVDAGIPEGVEKPYTYCTIEGAGARDKNGVMIDGAYGPEAKDQAPLIVTGAPTSLIIGETCNLSSLISGGSTTGAITYSVSGSGVDVSHEGIVTAVEAGTAAITVTKEGDTYFSAVSTTVTVNIAAPVMPTIHPASVNYDLTAPTDRFTTITWGSAASVTAVVHGSENLVLGTDYTVNGNKLTLQADYLEALTLTAGEVMEFSIWFNNNSTETLTVHVVKGSIPSDNANLKSLTISAGTLNPGFSENTLQYSVNVDNRVTSIKLTTVTADSNATVTINGTKVIGGNVIPISLNTGNNMITILITAENGSTKTYAIHMNRAAASGGGGSGGGTSGSNQDKQQQTNETEKTEEIKEIEGSKDTQEASPPQKRILLTIGKREIVLNNETHQLDAMPFIDGETNRILVPLKFISEALGATVAWLPETRQVLITEGDTEILLTIGSKEVLVNGEMILIDTEPRIIPPGRTFVPLRVIGELLGATVTYDEGTREIRIEK